MTASAAFAGDAFEARHLTTGWHVRQPARFIVSGVLRKDGTTDVIKPIHAILVADDTETAVRKFKSTATGSYPGYTLIATLASPVPAAGTCESAI
jgi:hypothetical protein